MADQKISQLTAVVVPTGADEFAVNQGGVSKKETLTQIIGGTIQGSIPFMGSGGTLVQDSSNFFFDSAGLGFGIGINTPDGTMHVHTGNAGTVNAGSQQDDLVVENNSDAGITILSPDANVTSIVFGSPGGIGGEGARLRWSNTNNLLSIVTTETGADIILAPGFLNEAMRLKSSGEVGIGTSTPDASSLLDVDSTTQGLLPPRMTTTQRDAISSPAAGLIIYNTTTNLLNFFNGSVWGAV